VKSRLAALTLTLTLAAPALADTPEHAAIFVDAMRDNGCVMTGAEADAVLPGLGLSVFEVEGAISVLFPAQLVALSEDGEALLLSEALCAADAGQSLTLISDAFDSVPVLEPWSPQVSPVQGAALIAALRDNGCAMTEDEAAELLPGLGLDMALTRDAVGVLLDAGVVTLSEDGGTLRLNAAVCAADPDDDALLFAEALADFVPMPPMTSGADPLEVLTGQFGLDGIRAMTELYVEINGCSIGLGERSAAEGAIAGFVAEQMTMIFNFAPDWPEDARAELHRLVGEVLDDPGPAFVRDGDTLTLTNCTP